MDTDNSLNEWSVPSLTFLLIANSNHHFEVFEIKFLCDIMQALQHFESYGILSRSKGSIQYEFECGLVEVVMFTVGLGK